MVYYILFKGVTQVMDADVRLSRCGVSYEIVPVPKAISSQCGVCIRTEELDRALECLGELSPVAVYDEGLRRIS